MLYDKSKQFFNTDNNAYKFNNCNKKKPQTGQTASINTLTDINIVWKTKIISKIIKKFSLWLKRIFKKKVPSLKY